MSNADPWKRRNKLGELYKCVNLIAKEKVSRLLSKIKKLMKILTIYLRWNWEFKDAKVGSICKAEYQRRESFTEGENSGYTLNSAECWPVCVWRRLLKTRLKNKQTKNMEWRRQKISQSSNRARNSLCLHS